MSLNYRLSADFQLQTETNRPVRPSVHHGNRLKPHYNKDDRPIGEPDYDPDEPYLSKGMAIGRRIHHKILISTLNLQESTSLMHA